MKIQFLSYFKNAGVLLCSALLLFSCSKNNNDDSPGGSLGNSTLTMKVNGENWNSFLSTLFTEEEGNSEQGDFRYVSVGGSRIIEKSSATEDDLAETITLFIAIPESKFRNPKGTYPIILKDFQVGYAWSIFGSSTDLRDTTTYVSGDANNPEEPVGTLEITGFKIGEQTVLGHPSGKEGYTQLSGTFNLDVYPLGGVGERLKITDGKFNISAGLDFGF